MCFTDFSSERKEPYARAQGLSFVRVIIHASCRSFASILPQQVVDYLLRNHEAARIKLGLDGMSSGWNELISATVGTAYVFLQTML